MTSLWRSAQLDKGGSRNGLLPCLPDQPIIMLQPDCMQRRNRDPQVQKLSQSIDQ